MPQTILVTGNCQSTALARILEQKLARLSDYFCVTAWPELHLIKDEDLDDLFSVLAKADIVLSMPVGDNYRSMPLGTAQLRERIKNSAKLIIYPNLYYKGYFPHYAYVKDAAGAHITPLTHPVSGYSPFGDYHDCLAAEFFFSQSIAPNSLAELHAGFGEWLRLQSRDLEFAYKTVSHRSLLELEAREKGCSLTVLPYIKSMIAQVRLFHSFNHPANILLGEVATSVISLCGLESTRPSSEVAVFEEFLFKPRLPVLAQVAKATGLLFGCDQMNAVNNAYSHYFMYLRQNESVFKAAYECNAFTSDDLPRPVHS